MSDARREAAELLRGYLQVDDEHQGYLELLVDLVADHVEARLAARAREESDREARLHDELMDGLGGF